MSKDCEYLALETHHPNCRVLELLPGAFDDDIQVRLRMSELVSDGIQPFEALSYLGKPRKAPEDFHYT